MFPIHTYHYNLFSQYPLCFSERFIFDSNVRVHVTKIRWLQSHKNVVYAKMFRTLRICHFLDQRLLYNKTWSKKNILFPQSLHYISINCDFAYKKKKYIIQVRRLSMKNTTSTSYLKMIKNCIRVKHYTAFPSVILILFSKS